MEIPANRMFVMNASSKTTGLNAYVTGFGASKRVVVWDNTIKKATVPETLFVFGHEMGHYVLHHIPKEICIDAAILLSFCTSAIAWRLLVLFGTRCDSRSQWHQQYILISREQSADCVRVFQGFISRGAYFRSRKYQQRSF